MKKLMIAAAIVCAAAYAQAASISWGLYGNGVDQAGNIITEAPANMTFILAMSNGAGGWTQVGDAGTWDIGEDSGESWANVGGKATAGDIADWQGKTFSIKVIVDGKIQDVQLAEGGVYATTLTVPDDATGSYVNSKTLTSTADFIAQVPEPTSGLLLLLGVAGLALKRKRA